LLKGNIKHKDYIIKEHNAKYAFDNSITGWHIEEKA